MLIRITNRDDLRKIMQALYMADHECEWFLDMIYDFGDEKLRNKADTLKPERDAVWETFPSGDGDKDYKAKEAMDEKAMALLDDIELPAILEIYAFGTDTTKRVITQLWTEDMLKRCSDTEFACMYIDEVYNHI